MKIICFSAPKGGGKDTAAAILIKAKKANGKISFAGPLKDICSKVFKIPLQVLNDPVLKETPFKQPITLTKKHLRDIKNECVTILNPEQGNVLLYNPNKASVLGIEGRVMNSPRELMQFIGTDFIRNRIFQGWHLNAAFGEANLSKCEANGVYCVTDARFFNEYEFLRDRFGDDFSCYYVERPEAEENLKNATHASELETQKIKAALPSENIILNDGTEDDLKKKLLSLDFAPAPRKKGSRFKFGTK